MDPNTQPDPERSDLLNRPQGQWSKTLSQLKDQELTHNCETAFYPPIANEFANTVKIFCTPAQKLFFDKYTHPIMLALLSDVDENLPDAERREIILERVEKEIGRRVQSNDPDGIATTWAIANLPPGAEELAARLAGIKL